MMTRWRPAIRLAGRRLGRRTLLGAGAAAGGAAFLAACGGDDQDEAQSTTDVTRTAGVAATTAADQQAKTGGEYRVGFTGPFAGVDPHNSVYGGSGIVPLVYNYLIRTSLVAPEKGILQELAVSQELAPDNVTTIFKLRPDAMIAQNNLGVPVRPIDAEDVKLSFERVGNPAAASNGFSWINEWVDKFEAVDPTTFRVVTKAPYAWVLNNVGNNLYSAVVPK
ncbi:MAG: ABC transporter substrate-binding protein, partial [Dehalococcoidia bacterium]